VRHILLKWRHLVCVSLVTILPVSLFADDAGPAMLRSNSGVLLNKNAAPASAALFHDDLIETPKNTAARIEYTGSAADINAETVIQFEGDELVLEHGSLSVNTSRVLRVRVGCITVTPVNADWTQYEVADVDGKVTVSSLKSDVYIDAKSNDPKEAKRPEHSGRQIVRESEQKERSEKCGAAIVKESTILAGRGAIMNSLWARGAGLAAIGVLTCWALCQSDDPLSPSTPGSKR
jgi:hypothetical protein